MRYGYFLIVTSFLFVGCSTKNKTKHDEEDKLILKAPKSKISSVVNNDPNVNGEGEKLPSPLGPLQKPRPRCQAPKTEWPKLQKKLPPVANILPKYTKSLKVLRKARVYREPNANSDVVGFVKQYSRLPLGGYVSGSGACPTYWLNLGYQRYICGKNLKPDRRSVLLRHQPILKKGMITPGKYGRIRRTGAPYFRNLNDLQANKPMGTFHRGDMIQLMKFKSLGGKAYWITSKKFLVWDQDVLGYRVPRYHGIDFRKLNINLPAAIIRAKTKGAKVYEYPGGPVKKSVKPLKHYSIHAIYDRKKVGKTLYYRVKEGWILARRVLSAWKGTPPPGLKKCEKWIEVNISMQTLVAYEGNEPVYMAPISSGKRRHPTKYGIFRIWAKKAISDMTSAMGASERYSVGDVPWSMFFYLGQALHGAYWHSDFGNRKSHGCVNLTPIDARWLFEWTEPKVPDGWLEVWVNEKSPVPGTLVVVRHKYDHQVPFLRYARKLAPKEAVKKLDDIRKKELEKQTLRLLKQRKK